jgi:hypothetical protein
MRLNAENIERLEQLLGLSGEAAFPEKKEPINLQN